MAARISIEKASIVEATLALIRELGWEAVSARNIAARLGCSTMPIYSAIGSMEDLKSIAINRAEDMLFREQRRKRSDNESLDLAVGYVTFAREEPRLFRFVIESRGLGTSSIRPPLEEAREKGEKTEEATRRLDAQEAMEASRFRVSEEVEAVKDSLAGISDDGDRKDFLLQSWIFTHGLAELLAAGAFTMDDQEIIRHLLAAGGAFYSFAGRGGEPS